MKLFKFVLLTALLSSALFAASWDGTKGDITLSTTSRVVNNGAFDQSQVLITVKCSNLAVSAVRVTITYHGAAWSGTESRLIQLNALRSGTATFPYMSESELSAPPIVTELFDGASTQF